MLYAVLASVISLPLEPAYRGETVDESRFNDPGHIKRLLDQKAIKKVSAIPDEDDLEEESEAAPSVSLKDLRQAAKDLGVADYKVMDESALRLAIATAGV